VIWKEGGNDVSNGPILLHSRGLHRRDLRSRDFRCFQDELGRNGNHKRCRNWTSSTQGAAMVGHIDRKELRDDAASRSWSSSHPSRGADGGCSQADLRSTGGDGGPLNENHRSRAF
jgi:hypothetical protein